LGYEFVFQNSFKGSKVIAAKPVLTNQSRLLEVVNIIKREDIDPLIIMNGTWSADSLQIEIVSEVRRPLLLWALSYQKLFHSQASSVSAAF